MSKAYHDYDSAYIDFITNTDPTYNMKKCAEKFGIPRNTLHDVIRRDKEKFEKGDADGRDWFADRQKNRQAIMQKVINRNIESTAKVKISMINDNLELVAEGSDILRQFMDDVRDGNIEVKASDYTSLLNAITRVQKFIAEMSGFLNKGAGERKIVFNINVPVEYLTPEGRKYVKELMDNPAKIEDVEYEVEDAESNDDRDESADIDSSDSEAIL